MGNPMKIRARSDGGLVEVKILMSHVMETGLRKSPDGQPIPPHFIQTVTVTCAERVVLAAQWGTGVSANPFLSFKFHGGKKGDRLKVSWRDNQGESRSDEVVIS